MKYHDHIKKYIRELGIRSFHLLVRVGVRPTATFRQCAVWAIKGSARLALIRFAIAN
jgi:hypothetical protein